MTLRLGKKIYDVETGKRDVDDGEGRQQNDDDDNKGELPWLLCSGQHHLPPLGRRPAEVKPFYKILNDSNCDDDDHSLCHAKSKKTKNQDHYLCQFYV